VRFDVCPEKQEKKHLNPYTIRDIGSLRKIEKNFSKSVDNEYRSERKVILREQLPGKVMSYISNRLLVPLKGSIILKSKRRVMEFGAFCAYPLSSPILLANCCLTASA